MFRNNFNLAQIAQIDGTTVPQSYQFCVRKLCLLGYKLAYPEFPDIVEQISVRENAQNPDRA